MKYYAVKYQDEKKVFTTWDECLNYITGKKGFHYKAFLSLAEANLYLNEETLSLDYNQPKAYIDGSYDKATGRYSFGGVLIAFGKEYQFKKAFEADAYSTARNVAGEIKGAGYIINQAYKLGLKTIIVYYDYIGIEKWYSGEWQASSPIAKAYVSFVADIKDKIMVYFVKVKSHSNNKYNDLADKLAKEALGIN